YGVEGALGGVEDPEPPAALLGEQGGDAVGVEESPGAHAENPQGHGEVRRHGQQAFGPVHAQAVEVPPAPAVRHVAQFATGGPAGLEEGFAAPAGDTGGADEGAVRGEFTAPQLAAVPG